MLRLCQCNRHTLATETLQGFRPVHRSCDPPQVVAFHSGVAMAAKQVLQKALDPIWNWASRRYQAAVAKELKKYGLRYDDLYDDMYDLDIKEALNRLPQQEVDYRNQRLKRAMDYSMKHQYLPKDLQAKQTPYEPYLQDALQLVKEERREHAELGSDLPYTRSLP